MTRSTRSAARWPLALILWVAAVGAGCDGEPPAAQCANGAVFSPLVGCVQLTGDANPCGEGAVWNGSQCVADNDAAPAADVTADATAQTDTAQPDTAETDAAATDASASDAAATTDAEQLTDAGADTDAATVTDTATDPDGQPGFDAAASDAAAADADVAEADASAGGTDALVIDVPPVGPCVPDCNGKVCGGDGCGGSCGTCQFVAGKPFCSATGQCVANNCVPDCTDSECGDDGCGGSCGTCPAGKGCTLHYCQALTAGESCEGYCGGFAPSGCSCEPGCEGIQCCPDAQAACGCKPQCDGKGCGPDGCGGSCGSCEAGTVCSADGTCEDDPCLPDPCNGHGSCTAGVCTCVYPYVGAACDACSVGLVGYPLCTPDPCAGQNCSGNGSCDPKTGACICNPGFASANCGSCQFSFQTFPDCSADPCDGVECAFGECNPTSGQCQCFSGFAGAQCDACAAADQVFPDCKSAFAVDPVLAGLECSFCAQPLAQFVTATELGDTMPPSIVLSVPTAGTVVGPDTPIILLLDDYVDAASVTTETFAVINLTNESVLDGSIVAQGTASGQTLLIFFPKGMAQSGEYAVGMQGVKDNSGNPMGLWQINFLVDGNLAEAGGAFVDNPGFELGSIGCALAGDVTVSASSGGMITSEGSQMLVLSTGQASEWSLAPGQSALEDRASLVRCGPFPVPENAAALRFDVDFGSAEYDQYVGQSFDDLVVAAVAGPNGGAGGVLVSVNAAAQGAQQTSAFGLPNTGDADQIFRHTGVQTVEIGGIAAVGSYITLVFAITDVADTSYPSVLTLDNVRFVQPD